MQLNLQDAYLGQLKKDNMVVVVYLVNGFQLKGLIKGFDNFTVFLENEGKIQMVYKHAITTISPVKAVHLSFLSEAFKVVATPKDPNSLGKKEDKIIKPPAMATMTPLPSGVREV